MKIDQTFPYLQYKGSSTFKFSFTIDFDFYDKGAGGKGSKTAFWFVLNCRTGQIVAFESISEKEKPYIRIPYSGKVESPWAIESYKGEPFRLDIHGPYLEHYSPKTDEVKNIEKTINSSNFRSVADAVLSKIRAHQGDSFIGEDPAEASYWSDPKRQNRIKVIEVVKKIWNDHISPEDINEVEIWNEGDELLPFLEDGSLFEALPNLEYLDCRVALTQLPEKVFSAQKLHTLSICGDQLKLPEYIGELPSLEYLTLDGTIELPENIGDWTRLEMLNLERWEGDIISLPDSLANLKVENFEDGFEDSIFPAFFEKCSDILNNVQPVQDTSRRGYEIPEDEEAEALMKQLKGREKLWIWLADRKAEFHIEQETILDLLQSQSKNRHLRGAWLASDSIYFRLRIGALFLNNGPCEDLAFLKHLDRVKILILDNTKIPDLSPLQYCMRLKVLSLRGAIAEDFSVLGKPKALERLILDGVPQFKDAQLLSELASLKELDLRGTGITKISQIPDLPALETLRLGVSEQPVSLQGIERFSSLKMLDITGSEVQSLEKIGQLSNLEKLRIFNAKFSDAKVIEGKTSLKELCLGNCELTQLDISGFTALDHLDLLGTEVKLSGNFQKRPGILSVDSTEMLKEVIPDVEKKARESNITEADELPPFSVTIGKNLREE